MSTKPKTYNCLLLADLHVGQLIKEEDVLGYNKYNSKIAAERMRKVVDQVPDKPTENLYIFCLGDLIQGHLAHHPQFERSMEYGIVEQMVHCKDILVEAFLELSKKYKKLYVYNSVGNHSRLSHLKTPPNIDIGDNFDWLVMDMVSQQLGRNKKISITNSKSPYNTTKLGGNNILYTHGDRLLKSNAYNSVSNSFRDANAVSDDRVDFIFCGHFHHSIQIQHGMGQFLVMCPSLVGADPYALHQLKKASLPAQTYLEINGKKIVNSKLLFC